MKKSTGAILLFILLGMLLIGSGSVGSKAASASVLYGTAVVLSLTAALGYWFLIRKKDLWFILLFSSVFVVNTGYYALSLSRSLPAALWANRLAYTGSVFLPLSMLMIILNTCRLKYHKALPGILAGVGIIVLMIAASPGVLDIYYSDVSLVIINGAAVLEKVYGPWHCIYLLYLLAYMLATATVTIHACACKRVESSIHALFISEAVFLNMGVWLLEQLIRIDFELLSVSYIISEIFLLLLCLMRQKSSDAQACPENPAAQQTAPTSAAAALAAEPEPDGLREQRAYFAAHRASLTPTERIIYQCYLEGKTTKEIMADLNIKENTLKYHNKNIYSKLGVSSRKQLVLIASMLDENE